MCSSCYLFSPDLIILTTWNLKVQWTVCISCNNFGTDFGPLISLTMILSFIHLNWGFHEPSIIILLLLCIMNFYILSNKLIWILVLEDQIPLFGRLSWIIFWQKFVVTLGKRVNLSLLYEAIIHFFLVSWYFCCFHY